MSADNDWQTLVNIAHAQAVKGISPLRPLTSYRNLGALIAEHVSAQPQRPLWLEAVAGGAYREHSYRDLDAEARQLAKQLRPVGLWRSDRVAILTSGTASVLRLYWAAWIVGASIVPLAADDDDRRIAANLREANARVFFSAEALVPRARGIAASMSGIVAPIVLRELDALRPAEHGERLAPLEPARDDEALLAYVPNGDGAAGAVLNHYNLLATAGSLARWNRWTPVDRIVSSLPLSGVTGIVGALVAPLSAGASICILTFDADTYWHQVSEMRATVSLLTPGQLRALAEASGDARPAGLRLRTVICAGGPVQADTVRAFEARYGIPVCVAAGQPEASGWSFQMPADAPSTARLEASGFDGRASAGLPLDVNEAQIVDEDAAQAPPGVAGEIMLRGHNVMQGYHQRPDANRYAFATAWYRTGRTGSYDMRSDGSQSFRVTGNRSGAAERDGVLLSLADVDRVLAELAGIVQAVAVAFDCTQHGEEIGAYITVEPGMHMTESEVISFCRGHLGFAKSPKVIVFGAPLAVGVNGDLDRDGVRPLFAPYLNARFDDVQNVGSAESSANER